ncbi:MAG TPA: glycosyl hydrolase, partial [Polyangiales bacterium]
MGVRQSLFSIAFGCVCLSGCAHRSEGDRDAASADPRDHGAGSAAAVGGENAAGSNSPASAGRSGAHAGDAGAAGSAAADGGRSGAGSGGAAAVGGRESGRAGSGGESGAAGRAGSAARPYKGVANSPCAARGMLGVAWYYNWTEAEDEACSDGTGGDFVPMIWGKPGAEQTSAGISQAVAGFVKQGYGYVLGFNEPDNSSQSNIAVDDALALWPAFVNPSIQVGSPGTQANADPGQTWFKAFMAQLQTDSSLHADFLAIHWYGWNAGSCDAKASQLESYLKWAEAFPGGRP